MLPNLEKLESTFMDEADFYATLKLLKRSLFVLGD